MSQRILFILFSAALLAWLVGGACATGWRKTNNELALVNQGLSGKVIDHTANHGVDNRIWSRSLGQRRDLYVYLPPDFDPHLRYPLMLAFHGNGYDEQSMLRIFQSLDKAIRAGQLPPLIVAAPDGSSGGEPGFAFPGTFFINSELGDFEDFVLNDVWDFVATHYPIRSERESHILAGVSMGGFAAFSIGIRHRYCFGTVVGMFPPLNLRWMDDCCHYQAKFDPHHWGWRTKFDRPHEFIGRVGALPLSVKHIVQPLFSSPEQAIAEISRLNPIELVERTCLRNAELNMYVGYGADDEFNIDAQIESFLYLCKYRQINVGVGYDPDGHHDAQTVYRLTPGMISWLGPRLAAYNAPACTPAPAHVSARPHVARKQAPPQPLAATRDQATPPKTPENPNPNTAPAPAPATASRPESDPNELVGPPTAPTASAPPRPTLAGPPTSGLKIVRPIPIPSRADLGPYSGPPVSPSPAPSVSVPSAPAPSPAPAPSVSEPTAPAPSPAGSEEPSLAPPPP